jgi:hypothetical protein
MRFVIIALVIANLLLFMVVVVRMKDAPEPAPRPVSSASAAAPSRGDQPSRGSPASATRGGDGPAPGERFVDAMKNKGGADAPPGLEGAVGVSGRNEYDVDVEGDPNALQDTQAEGLDDAKERIRGLPLVGGR